MDEVNSTTSTSRAAKRRAASRSSSRSPRCGTCRTCPQRRAPRCTAARRKNSSRYSTDTRCRPRRCAVPRRSPGLLLSCDGTADRARGLDTAVTAHREIVALRERIVAALHLAHLPPPVQFGEIAVLLVAEPLHSICSQCTSSYRSEIGIARPLRAHATGSTRAATFRSEHIPTLTASTPTCKGAGCPSTANTYSAGSTKAPFANAELQKSLCLRSTPQGVTRPIPFRKRNFLWNR
jgi:hypothetical protein